jgi:cytochrome c
LIWGWGGRDARRTRRCALAIVALGVAVLEGGCTAKIATAPKRPQRDQVALGKAMFLARCAKCHGQSGEGKTGRALVASWDPLAGYRNADQLFAYVSRVMPYDNPGSLTEQEYWDVIAFLLDANQVLPRGTEVGKDNARTVKTTK